MPSKYLVEKVISGVVLSKFEVRRNGAYQVTESLRITQGKRNCPDGYWINVYESGGFDSHSSFYGDCGEPFDTAENAAIAAIKRRSIVAVDAKSQVIFNKK